MLRLGRWISRRLQAAQCTSTQGTFYCRLLFAQCLESLPLSISDHSSERNARSRLAVQQRMSSQPLSRGTFEATSVLFKTRLQAQYPSVTTNRVLLTQSRKNCAVLCCARMCILRSACVCGCVYLHLYVCMYVCMYLCIYVSMYLCIYVSMYVRMHACMFVCGCVFVVLLVCLFVYLFRCFFVCLPICLSA